MPRKTLEDWKPTEVENWIVLNELRLPASLGNPFIPVSIVISCQEQNDRCDREDYSENGTTDEEPVKELPAPESLRSAPRALSVAVDVSLRIRIRSRRYGFGLTHQKFHMACALLLV
ncbi:MAG: hypothetical protein O7C75_17930 [Verrucomicrobia bacterium]|nr:hypothetical protein [Verrucomicrobiota bacterium]